MSVRPERMSVIDAIRDFTARFEVSERTVRADLAFLPVRWPP